MVSFYKPAKGQKKGPSIETVTIDSWDMHGQGVCKSRSPILFVDGALPGESVSVRVTSRQKYQHHGNVKKVVSASAQRQQPFCPVAKRCGGCQLQHADSGQALEWRQQAIDSHWQKQLGLCDIPWQTPITGQKPAYRRKARLAVDARNENTFLVGYREEGGKNIVDIAACPVLDPRLSDLISPLKTLLASHKARRYIGHISLLAGDEVCQVSIRMTRPLVDGVEKALVEFARQHEVNLSVESDKGELKLYEHKTLTCHTENELVLRPEINDFVQVNRDVNTAMISQAMQWLDPQHDEHIADWFSGLGNFSLSLAARGCRVQAVEGVIDMVQRAKDNALLQGIENVDWRHIDLSDSERVAAAMAEGFDKVLLDPSREGAYTVCEQLAKNRVSKILYVSCNPSTLTRDARSLLEAGYQMEKVGLVEMFPYTRHLEVMALFTDTKK